MTKLDLYNTAPDNLPKEHFRNINHPEHAALKKIVSYLWDGEQAAFNFLFYMTKTYKQWPEMLIYLKNNKIRGKKITELMQNESPDGGGYLLGCTWILNRIKGDKMQLGAVLGNELL